MIDFKKIVQEERQATIDIRRDLHRIPEMAFCEEKTSAFVSKHLRKLGLKVETEIAKTGVVGLLELGKEGKTLMIRADMEPCLISAWIRLMLGYK